MNTQIPISINREGKNYKGYYEMDRRMITVHYDFKQTTTQLGASNPEILAHLLLSELIN